MVFFVLRFQIPPISLPSPSSLPINKLNHLFPRPHNLPPFLVPFFLRKKTPTHPHPCRKKMKEGRKKEALYTLSPLTCLTKRQPRLTPSRTCNWLTRAEMRAMAWWHGREGVSGVGGWRGRRKVVAMMMNAFITEGYPYPYTKTNINNESVRWR